MSTHIFEAPTIGLGRILSEGSRYLVPNHQRDYSWGEDEVAQLFRDIEESRNNDSDYYFLGLMVFIPNNGDFVILDGQQRMATSLIVLSAIRTWLRGYGFDRDADQIQSTFIARRELGEEELHPRLILNEVNNHIFHSYVISEKPSSVIQEAILKLKKYDPNRTLLESVILCRQEVNKIASSAGEPKAGAKKLFDIVNFLRDNVRVVRITVPSEADAYTVFETLNDRGLDLSVLDLVKNYIFGKAGSKTRLGEIKNRWTQMMATLTNVRGDDFLKVYWTSRYGRTQKTQLFPNIKRIYKTPENIAQFSVDLLEASEHFSAIELADDPIWENFSDKTRDRIRALKMLRSQSIHPIILSGLSKFPQREMERLLWLLEVLIVRYQLIGGGRTGILEITSAKLAADIYNGKIKTATDAYHAIQDIYPSDTEFQEAFSNKQERNNTKAQYLLRNLEEEARKKELNGKAGVELAPKALTVEHIFPKASGPDWKSLEQEDPAFIDDCLYRLGNLTLLGNVNKDLGQKGFLDKRLIYSSSALCLTKQLAEYDKWNRDLVEKRQKAMARLALSAWRFQ